jgi:cell division initiation protein
MRITPIDIQQQQFKSSMMGYDKSAVDHFLELVAGELERLLRQNQDLQVELARTKGGLAEMREREATVQETLLTTQKVTDELKANARREADLLLADAQLRAERLMHNAEDRRLQLLEEVQEIRRQKVAFETGLRSLLEQHLRLIELTTLPRDDQGGGKPGRDTQPVSNRPADVADARPADAAEARTAANPAAAEQPDSVLLWEDDGMLDSER